MIDGPDFPEYVLTERDEDDKNMDDHYPESRRTPILRPLMLNDVDRWDFDLGQDG